MCFDTKVFKDEIVSSDVLTEEDILLKNVLTCMLENRLYDIEFEKINFKILFKIKKAIEIEENPIIHNIISYGFMRDFIINVKAVYEVGEDEVW